MEHSEDQVSRSDDNLWAAKSADQIPSTLWPDDFFFSELDPHSKILDIGCGLGALAHHLAAEGHEVLGIDLSHDAIRQATQHARDRGLADHCYFHQASATALPFNPRTFDFAIVQAVLTTVPSSHDRRDILSELFRVLKPKGSLYLAEFAQTWHRPDYRNRYLANAEYTGEVGLFVVRDEGGNEIYWAKHFSQREVVDLVVEAGLEITKFRHAEFRTRSGNTIDGFQLMAQPRADVVSRKLE